MLINKNEIKSIQEELNDKDLKLNTKLNHCIKLIKSGSPELVKDFLEIDNSLFKDKNYFINLFIRAIETESKQLIQYILKHKDSEPNIMNGKMLIHALKTKNLEVVKLFLESDRIDHFSKNLKAYRNSMFIKWQEVVDIFEEKLKKRKLTEFEKRELVICFIKQQDVDKFINFMENNKINLDFDKALQGGLLRMIINNNLDIRFIKYLLNKTDINVNERQGAALLLAIERQQTDIIDLLISHPNINIYERNGKIMQTAEKYGLSNYIYKRIVKEKVDNF